MIFLYFHSSSPYFGGDLSLFFIKRAGRGGWLQGVLAVPSMVSLLCLHTVFF